MTDRDIVYRSGYKYQLVEEYHIEIPIKPDHHVSCENFIELSTDGLLTVCEGYAWDGATSIIDTKRNLRASLVHDALYQLLRKEKLPPAERDTADRLFQSICKQDGVWSVIASAYYFALKQFGKPAAEPANEKKNQYAPGLKYGEHFFKLEL